MPKRTRDYKVGLLKELKSPLASAHYLNAALEDSDESFLLALRDVVEALRVAKVAQDAGVSRESLYRMLSETGNPRYSSLFGILRAVGLRAGFVVEPLNREAIPVGTVECSGIEEAIRTAEQHQPKQFSSIANIEEYRAKELNREKQAQQPYIWQGTSYARIGATR